MNHVYGVNNTNLYRSDDYRKTIEQGDGVFSELMGRMDIVKKDYSAETLPFDTSAVLSKDAEKYLEELKLKFPNFQFEVKDNYTREDLNNMAKAMRGEIGCIMNVALIEKMAADENFRMEYEELIQKAEDDFNSLKDAVAEYEKLGGANFSKQWSYIVEVKNSEFFYNIIDGDSVLMTASSLSTLLDILEDYIEQNQPKNLEQSEIYSGILFNT